MFDTVPIQRPANIEPSYTIKWYKAKGTYHKALKFAKDGFSTWSQKTPRSMCPIPSARACDPHDAISQAPPLTTKNLIFSHIQLVSVWESSTLLTASHVQLAAGLIQ
jgi:hypothetical protein